jgi:hypothetical protein
MWQCKRQALVAAVLLPGAVFCQSLGYADADNPSEAVGMMQTTQRTARIMMEQCVGRFPELRPEMERNLLKWQTTEASAIRKSNYYWAEMAKKDARVGANTPAVETAIRKSIAAVSEMPGEAGAQAFRQVCGNHFASLASGIWRTRTPKAYTYLDSAP